jgi:deazaflavin-dependent oxidoreductase (nitroreductase family)
MSTEVLERPVAVPVALIVVAPLAVRLPAVVRLLTAAHAAAFLQTNGRLLGRWFGTRILILETVGRHSGQIRRTPLVYLRDDADLVVVAANGGAPRHPGWWLNLRSAGHAVAVLGRDRMDVRPREARGHERERLWRRFAAATPVDAYQRHTPRCLPVVVLTPTSDEPSDQEDS